MTMVLRLLHEAPRHGYELIEALESLTRGRYRPEPGAMYTLLRRLERSGLTRSVWEENPSGPDRRIYRLTGEGEEVLRRRLLMLRERISLLQNLIDYYEAHFAKDAEKHAPGKNDEGE